VMLYEYPFLVFVLLGILFFSFFFQAEDGIRDFHVTGVQTCALPIFGGFGEAEFAFGEGEGEELFDLRLFAAAGHGEFADQKIAEIGRASCRERVEIWVVAVSLKEKKESRGVRRDSGKTIVQYLHGKT